MNILSIGYGHFVDKLGYQNTEYRELGINCTYTVLDKTSFSIEKAKKYNAEISILPKNPLLRLLKVIYLFRIKKIKTIEIYDTGLLTVIYSLLAKVCRINILFFLIGMELRHVEIGKDKASYKRRLKRLGLFLSLKMSSRVVYKELHMQEQLGAWTLLEKSQFLGNTVPLPHLQSLSPLNNRLFDVAFVNSIRKMRNPDLFINAIAIAVKERPNLRVLMAGFHTLDESVYKAPEPKIESLCLQLIRDFNLENNITCLPFVENAQELILNSKIFVLPADIVFANYALLEAMSMGVVPIVTSGNGAEKIVTSGENGTITDFDASKIASGILNLLNDPQTLHKFSHAARKTIETHFSIKSWVSELMRIHSSILNSPQSFYEQPLPKLVLSFSSRLIPAAINLFSLMAIPNIMGVSLYGRYALIFVYVSTLTSFAGGWYNQALFRFSNELSTTNFHSITRKYLFAAISIAMVGGLAANLLNLTESLSTFELAASATTIIAILFYNIFLYFFSSTARFTPLLIIETVKASAVLLLAYAAHKISLPVGAFIFTLGLSYLLAGFLGYLILKRSPRRSAVSTHEIQDFAAYGAPLSVALFISDFSKSVERSQITKNLGTEALGAYSVIFDLVTRSMYLFAYPITMYIQPQIVSAFQKKSFGEVRRIIFKSSVAIILISSVSYWFASLFSFFLLKKVYSWITQDHITMALYIIVGATFWQLGANTHKFLELRRRSITILGLYAVAFLSQIIILIHLLKIEGTMAAPKAYAIAGGVYFTLSTLLSYLNFKDANLTRP